MDEIAEFKAIVSKRLAEFGIPDWIEQECPLCKVKVKTKDIMGIEVHFVPMFLGDVGFMFFCPNCNASFSRHLKCDAHNLQEIANAFASDKQELIDRNELIRMGRHNLRINDWKPPQMLKTQHVSTRLEIIHPSRELSNP